MKYPLEKNIKRMKSKIGEISIYDHLNSLFLISARAIKIGKRTITYLGSPLNVPLKTGIKNPKIIKIK